MSILLLTLDDYVEDFDESLDEASDELDPFEIIAKREERVGMPMFFMPRSMVDD